MSWSAILHDLELELQAAIEQSPEQPPTHLCNTLTAVKILLLLADDALPNDIFHGVEMAIGLRLGEPGEAADPFGSISAQLAELAYSLRGQKIGETTDGALATSSLMGRLRLIAQNSNLQGRFIGTSDPSFSISSGTRRFTVPLNRRWHLRSGAFTFVSSATVGNRFPGVYIIGPGFEVGYRYIAASQPASTTRLFSFGNIGVNPAVATVGSESHQHLPLPDLLSLPPGSRIELRDNAAIDTGGDSFTTPVIYVEEGVI